MDEVVAGERLELHLAVAHAAGGEGGEGGAVIGVVAADRLVAVLLGELVPRVLPRELEGGLVGLRARADEVDVVVAAQQPVHLLGERGGGPVHRGVRVVGEVPHLVRRDLGQLGAAVADVHAPEPGHAVEVLAAVGVHHRGVLAGDDDELLLLELPVGHDRVDDVVQVLPDHRRPVGGVRHGKSPVFPR